MGPISPPAAGHSPSLPIPPLPLHGSHPIQLPATFSGWLPGPGAGPSLHEHHLTACLVLIVLALPCIDHPARRKQGIKVSSTSCSSRAHLAAFHPPCPSRCCPDAPALSGAAAAYQAVVPDQLYGLTWGQQQHLLPPEQLSPVAEQPPRHPPRDQEKLGLLEVPTTALSRVSAPKPGLASRSMHPSRSHRITASSTEHHTQHLSEGAGASRRGGDGGGETSRTLAQKSFRLTSLSLCWHSRFQV